MKNLIALTFVLLTFSFSQNAISQEITDSQNEHAQSIDLHNDMQLQELSRLEFARLPKDEQVEVWSKISDEQKLGYWKEKIHVLKEQFVQDVAKMKFIQKIEDKLSLQFFGEEMSAETEQFFRELVDKAVKEWGLETDFVYHTVFSLDDYSPQ